MVLCLLDFAGAPYSERHFHIFSLAAGIVQVKTNVMHRLQRLIKNQLEYRVFFVLYVLYCPLQSLELKNDLEQGDSSCHTKLCPSSVPDSAVCLDFRADGDRGAVTRKQVSFGKKKKY